jgi:hypothetical protein
MGTNLDLVKFVALNDRKISRNLKRKQKQRQEKIPETTHGKSYPTGKKPTRAKCGLANFY